MKSYLALVAIFTVAIAGCLKPAPHNPAPAPVASSSAAVSEPVAVPEGPAPAVVEPAPVPKADEGAAAPTAVPPGNVSLRVLTFDEIQSLVASKKGKVVVMDAWSTSCPPCMEEFPHLVKLSKKHSPEKLACISLSFDYEGIGKPDDAEIKQPVIDFLTQQKATFDNVMSNEESDVLYRKFDLASIPAVFIYDQNGNLAKRFDNQKAKKKEDAFTYAQITAFVDDLIAKGPAPADTPTAEKPATPETPSAEKSAVTEAPAAEKPATEKPATEKPAATETPAVEKPAATEAPAEGKG